jgi:hypothetical protein
MPVTLAHLQAARAWNGDGIATPGSFDGGRWRLHDRLERLIQDLLYVSKIESREATLRTVVSGVAFYLSPVRLDGTLYYRVLAGPSADSASAARLMARLVAEGQRTEAESWAIRPTEWAYDLGEFDVRPVAEARRAELIRQAIPTYIVEIPYSWGPPRYRLYAGAYEGRGDADALGEILREAGYSPPLRTRMGQPIQ